MYKYLSTFSQYIQNIYSLNVIQQISTYFMHEFVQLFLYIFQHLPFKFQRVLIVFQNDILALNNISMVFQHLCQHYFKIVSTRSISFFIVFQRIEFARFTNVRPPPCSSSSCSSCSSSSSSFSSTLFAGPLDQLLILAIHGRQMVLIMKLVCVLVCV